MRAGPAASRIRPFWIMSNSPLISAPNLRAVRWLIALFIAGLVLSGVTAIPLQTEVAWLVKITGARNHLEERDPSASPAWAVWLCRVEAALRDVGQRYPFMGYGGDWLAFGHFMIALVFVWAWRDPLRHRWLFDYGLIACACVIPFALVFGSLRGIPLWWRLIDCTFGVLGAVPLLLCRRAINRLAAHPPART
jgi:hypothetical protein